MVRGIPIMLLEEADQTMELAHASLREARAASADDGLFIESLGLSDAEKHGIRKLAASKATQIDPVVSFLVGATNGIAYKNRIGQLEEYPIPELRFPPGQDGMLLDVGCSWGRWSIAASRRGYRVIGIDPSLGAVAAATRVARQLGSEAAFVVGDARFLPFKSGSIDRAFSYSVLQHFSRQSAADAVSEIARTLKEGGCSVIQMPAKLGIRCLFHQVSRGFREGTGFEVRYWSLPELRKLFSSRVGTTALSVDCYFGIGLQFSDRRFMTPIMKAAVAVSECLRRFSRFATPLIWVADSVYVSSVKKLSNFPDCNPLIQVSTAGSGQSPGRAWENSAR